MSSLNQSLFQFIHQFAGRQIFVDNLGIFFADYLPYILVIGFLYLAWHAGDWRKRLYILFEGAIAVILARGLFTEIIRFFYHHARPFDFYHFVPLVAESGSSFPSGHAAFFFALALVVWYVNRTWGMWYFALALVNGLARIYAGVHWPLDIVGGIAVGIIAALIVRELLKSSRETLYRTGAPPP